MAKLEYIQFEQSVIGLLLVNGSVISRCKKLAVSDFSLRTHQIIFEAIEHISSKGLAIDLVSVGEFIEKKYQQVDMKYLGELATQCYGVEANIEHHCDFIKTATRLRKAMEVAKTIQVSIELKDDCEGVIEHAIKGLMDIDSNTKNFDHTLGEAVHSAIESYQAASEKGGLIGVKIGLTELDEALGGFINPDLIVIGARPAMGKTALLFNFANACGVPAGIISAEQDYTQAGLRFISMDGEINNQHLRSAKLNQNELQKLPATIKCLEDKPIYINDEPGININSLMRQARIWKQNLGIEILYVDYIQKIEGSSPKQFPRDRVSEVVRSLKNLARELDIPVVALSQVNREADKLDHPPGPSNLSDASTVENEADSIITLWKDNDMKKNGQMLLHICKNRHGPCGDKTVNYLGKFFKFTDQGSIEAEF